MVGSGASIVARPEMTSSKETEWSPEMCDTNVLSCYIWISGPTLHECRLPDRSDSQVAANSRRGTADQALLTQILINDRQSVVISCQARYERNVCYCPQLPYSDPSPLWRWFKYEVPGCQIEPLAHIKHNASLMATPIFTNSTVVGVNPKHLKMSIIWCHNWTKVVSFGSGVCWVHVKWLCKHFTCFFGLVVLESHLDIWSPALLHTFPKFRITISDCYTRQ